MKPPPENAQADLSKTESEDTALTVDTLIESDEWRKLSEAEDIARRAIAAAAASIADIRCGKAELSVLFCDDETIAVLNGRWRGKEMPTNVLSFPALPLQGSATYEKTPLGDIAISYETLVRLVVHGFLHLLGYDHQTDDEAERMERLERDILARIGIADPYAACHADI
jgi:probable rRNA maturation factor